MEHVRRLFPHTAHSAYLNHAATGPLSVPVVEALQTYIDGKHRFEPNNYLAMEPVVVRCLDRIGRLVGAPADRVEFAPNTSYAINVLAQGLGWRRGDRVAVPACEFPANVMPWLGLADRGVAVDFIPHHRGTFSLDAVDDAIGPDTRVVAVSWVQFLSGFRVDLGGLDRLCRDRGVILAVDAIQGLGAIRLDLSETPVDFLACGAQKWLFGLPGTAFLYITEELQEQLTPMRGWFNGPVDFADLLAYDLTLHETANRFRVGTVDYPGIVALDAALEVYEAHDPAVAEQTILSLSRRAADGLSSLGLRRFGTDDPAHASGIVTFEHPSPESVALAMADSDVRFSVINRLVRVSPSWYNTPEEVDRVVDFIATTL